MTESAPQTPYAAPTRNPVTVIAGLIAGVLLVVGGVLLDWISGVASKGLDVPADILWSPVLSPDSGFFGSAGFVILIIALFTFLGAVGGRGGGLVFSGVLGVAAFVLVIITFYRADAGLGIGDAGIGLWAILVGGVLGIAAGRTGRNTS